jgi:hypothetical protein
MSKIYSILIGENPKYTTTFQPASKRKIALYANCLMIPVILWFINSYLLISHVLQGSIFIAILTGFIAAFIIFLIERAIIMSNGSKPIFWFRIFLGFIVASLGSLSFDEVIFKNDIDHKMSSYQDEVISSAVQKVNDEYKPIFENQGNIVNVKYKEWQKRLDDINKEMKGLPGSSGKSGKGSITQENIRIASLLQADYETEKDKLAVLSDSFAKDKLAAKDKAIAGFNNNALLIRIRAMFDLLGEDVFMLSVYILFTLFLFCLEFLVVLIKIGSQNSIDEDLEKARDILLRAKTKKVLERSALLFSPDQLVPSVKAANTVLSQKNTAIF